MKKRFQFWASVIFSPLPRRASWSRCRRRRSNTARFIAKLCKDSSRPANCPSRSKTSVTGLSPGYCLRRSWRPVRRISRISVNSRQSLSLDPGCHLDRSAHGHGQLLLETIVVMQLAVVTAEFMDQLGEFHVVTTVLGNIQQVALAKPFDSLHVFGRFLHAKGGDRDGIERKPVLQLVLQVDVYVQRGELAKVECRVVV